MRIKTVSLTLLGVIAAAALYIHLGASGALGERQGPGTIVGGPVPKTFLEERSDTQAEAAQTLRDSKRTPQKQILFGDFHAHTTFSNDAYMASLPMIGGLGTTPPADACDYARYCSALDFWSINDHAISLDSQRWESTKNSIRDCQAVADENYPDLISFIGFEWTQANPLDAATHYGHKNVIYRDLDDAQVASRPIYAKAEAGLGAFNPPYAMRAALPLSRWSDRQAYYDLNRFLQEMEAEPECDEGTPASELPVNCKEGAENPAVLFAKLREAGHETLVIPHGNAWGLYTPIDASWDKQLAGDMQDDDLQTVIEVFSGHGNSEEYRAFAHVSYDSEGKPFCPQPRSDFLPRCVQAGRIIHQRCLDQNGTIEECDTRAAQTRQMAAESPVPLFTVPGFGLEQWLDSGQCRDCYQPAYNYVPRNSAQYALAIGNFDNPDKVKRFRFGLMAASDNHTARPGTGYKERDRRLLIEGMSMEDPQFRASRRESSAEISALPRDFIPEENLTMSTITAHLERQDPFFATGGLMAVHSEQRSRDGVWNAVQRKEIYGTSGDRILLWFDLLNPPGAPPQAIAPMGSELTMSHNPSFRVRAVGARKQNPGCPQYAVDALGENRLQRLCHKECFNPSDERKLISRIEIVRIKPQITANENVESLIEDVWMSKECPADPAGCVVEFSDQDFAASGRETLYYARAIQEPSDAVNGGQLRCEYDEQGNCISVDFCSSSSLDTPRADDCLAPVEERAWSSPIWLSSNAPL